MNPGGGGWDEPPLDVQIPDDARELDRDVLAYHRELRARRRRNRLRGLTGPAASRGTLLPVLASILAVCLVAGAMLSVATFRPATGDRTRPPATTAASSRAPTPKASTAPATPAVSSAQAGSAQAGSAQASPAQASARASGTGRASRPASPSASGTQPSASSRVTAIP